MVRASHWVGLTLPGMMLLPGSFSGSESSPRPHLGPLPKKRMSFAIFMSDTATVFKAPEASTMASWAANASNLHTRIASLLDRLLEVMKIMSHNLRSVT